jgi:hypothetical protein
MKEPVISLRSMASTRSTPVEQLDLNKDGAASKTEIMQEFDSNNDGTISSREFAQHTLETPGKQDCVFMGTV